MNNPIKAVSLVALTMLFVTHSTSADDKSGELDQRIQTITAKFKAMQENPEKSIPRQTLQNARAILLLDRTKAGFLFAYQGGLGVAMAKDKNTGDWSAPAFLKAQEASVGVQVGVQQSFVVALFMNDEAAKQLTKQQMVLGGEARGTAGDESTGTEAGTDKDQPSVMVFYDREGVYGGAAVKGGTVEPDGDANLRYYGKAVSNREILFENKVKPSEAATELASTIQAQTRLADKKAD